MEELMDIVDDIRRQVGELAEKARLKRVTVEFPDVPIRAGDYFLSNYCVGRMGEPDSDGDANYTLNGRGWNGRPPRDRERLFTLEEVRAILAERT